MFCALFAYKEKKDMKHAETREPSAEEYAELNRRIAEIMRAEQAEAERIMQEEAENTARVIAEVNAELETLRHD